VSRDALLKMAEHGHALAKPQATVRVAQVCAEAAGVAL